eukprot:SAG11_NODE_6077_length_1392_cov_1.453210_2_plen_343_part_01
MPIQFYLRGVFNLENGDETKWYGAYFGNNQIIEHIPRDVVVHAGMQVSELQQSLKIMLDDDAGYGTTFPCPVPNPKTLKGKLDWKMQLEKEGDSWSLKPNSSMVSAFGRCMGDVTLAPPMVGLFALNHPEKVKADPKNDDLSSIFIPLSAILADPEFYCDKDRFPMFFDHNPDLARLKGDYRRKDRSEKKEDDFGNYYKKIVHKVRYWVCLVLVLTSSAFFVLMQLGYPIMAMAVAIGVCVVGTQWWLYWKPTLSDRQAQYIRFMQKWRWIKDDDTRRIWVYFFPLLRFAHYLPGMRHLLRMVEPDFERMPLDIIKGREDSVSYPDQGDPNWNGGRLFGRGYL